MIHLIWIRVWPYWVCYSVDDNNEISGAGVGLTKRTAERRYWKDVL